MIISAAFPGCVRYIVDVNCEPYRPLVKYLKLA